VAEIGIHGDEVDDESAGDVLYPYDGSVKSKSNTVVGRSGEAVCDPRVTGAGAVVSAVAVTVTVDAVIAGPGDGAGAGAM